MKAKEKKGPP